MGQWNEILSKDQLEAQFALTASLDPAFAAGSRAWWEGASVNLLLSTMTGAWYANDSYAFQMARSYLALANVKV